MDECSDEDIVWYPQRLVCRKTMDLMAAERKWAALHDAMPYHDGSFKSWVKERSDSHPFHYTDGVRLWVSDVDYTPDDDFLSGRGVVDREQDDSGEQ